MSDKRTLEQTISLQMDEALGSLRSLKSEVKQVTDAWKLQDAQLRQNGEYEEAYRAKVTGLEHAMTQQRQGIEQLKSTMNSFSTETKAGAEAHDKLAQEVLKAERSLQSMSSQHEKAQNTLSLYESGVIQARKALEQSEKVSVSYQDKLRAEGKEVEANAEKRRFLSEKVKALTDLQEKETSILEKVRKHSGESSEAFQKQAVRVNELATKVAHSKTEFTELDRAISKKPNAHFEKLKEQLGSLNDKAEKTHHLFGKILGADLLSRAAFSGFETLKEGIKEATHAGFEFNQEQQVMSAAWNTLTSDAVKAREMVTTINDVSVATGRSRDLVNELEQGFYHLHSNKEESDNLTKSMLNMGDAVGLADDAITTVTQDMVHGLSTGKLNLQELNQLSQYFPMFSESLLDYERKVTGNSQLTMAELRKMTTQGKISAETVEKLFNELGQDKYGKAAENMLQTMTGMKRTISSQVPALIGAFEKPILTAQNPFYGAVSKWVSDHKTQDKFTEMGNSAEKGVETIMSSFQKVMHPGSSVNVADHLLDSLNQHIKTGSQYIADHAPQIVQFLSQTKETAVGLFTRGEQTLKGFYEIAKPFLGVIRHYPKQVGELIAVMYLAKPAIGGITLAMKGFEIFKSAIGWISGLRKEMTLLNATKVATPNLAMGGASSKSGGLDPSLFIKGGGKATALEEGAASAGKLAGIFGKFGKLIPVAGVAIAGLTELIGMTKKTAGQHIGGAVGSVGGAVGGAALGSMVLPGIGTVVGGVLGALGGSAIGKKLGSEIQKGLKDVFSSKTPLKDAFTKDLGHVSSSVNNELVKVATSTSGFSKDEKAKFDQLYSDLDKKTDKYFQSKQKNSKKDLDLLVKNGVITREQAEKMLREEQSSDKKKSNTIKEAYANQKKLTDNYYKDYNSLVKTQKDNEAKLLDSYAKKYGKNSKQYADEKLKIEQNNKKALDQLHTTYFSQLQAAQTATDSVISKELDKNGKKQTQILNNLKDAKHKISLKEAQEAIQASSSATNKIIKNAETLYSKKKKSADEQYQATIKAAKKERDESGTISESQYDEIVKNAKRQRDDSVSAAKDQKDKTVQSAKDKHTQVVDEATKQANEHKGALDTETGFVKGSVEDQGAQQAKGINAIIDGIDWVWKLFTGHKTKIPHMKVPGHKDGLNTITHGEIAVVGEEGFELAHHPSQGIFPVGVGGQEVRYLEPQTSILPHEQSKQFLSMTQGLPHYAGGVGDFFGNLYSGAKDLVLDLAGEAKDVWGAISGGAGKAWDYLLKKFKFDGWFKQESSGESGKSNLGFSLKEAGNAAKEQLKTMLDFLGKHNQSDNNNFSGGIGEAGVYSYLTDLLGPLRKQWPALQITSGYRPGDPYFHGKHMAMDVAGGGYSGQTFTDIANYAFEHFQKRVAYVITNGQVRDRKGYSGTGVHDGWKIWPDHDHFDHVHINGALGPGYGTLPSGGRHGGNWEAQIKAAAQSLGVNLAPWQIQNLLKQIQTESGGNEKVVQQIQDINSAMGNPAKGLLQFIPQTFAQWAVPGHTNIFSGFDQILAAIKRLNSMNTWNYIGQGHGWERGGFISRHGYYELGEGGNEEAIIPMNKGMRSIDMMHKVMNKLGVSREVAITNDNSELVALAKGQLQEMSEQNHFLRQILEAVVNLPKNTGGDFDTILNRLSKEKRMGEYQWP